MKINSIHDSEAAAEAAFRFNCWYIRDFCARNGGIKPASVGLGYSETYIFNTLKRGNFSAVRRLANAIYARQKGDAIYNN
ncbi:MAG: hypothetical protein KDK39_01290 [Leptospiraceae bacterium]|nr:hypothetical protein [Leptospiraceae bacterium]